MEFEAFLKILERIRGYLKRRRGEFFFLSFLSLFLPLYLFLVFLHHLFSLPYFIFLIFFILGGLTFLILLLYPFLKTLSLEKVAYLLDSTFHTRNLFINTLQLAKREDTLFRRLFLKRALNYLKRVDFSLLIDRKRRNFLWRLNSSLLILASLYFFLFPTHFQLPPKPASPLYLLKISPGNTTVMEGASLTIKAVPLSQVPPFAKVKVEGEEFLMSYSQNSFSYTLSDIQEPFSYQVVSPGFLSPSYRVKVVERLLLLSSTFEVTPPPYTGKDKFTLQNPDKFLQIPEGSSLSFTLLFNRDIEKVKGKVKKIKIKGKKVTGKTKPEGKEFKLKVEDKRGFTLSLTFPYKFIPDLPPHLNFISPGKDLEGGRGETLKITLGIEDDYGLKQVRLKYRKGEEIKEIKEWRLEGEKEKLITFLWNLKGLSLKEGDSILYWAEAQDNCEPEGKWGKSKVYTYRVKAKLQEERQEEETLLSIRNLLEREISLRDKTSLAKKENRGINLDRIQEGIRRDALRLSEMEDLFYPFPVRRELKKLAEREMSQAVRLLSYRNWEEAIQVEEKIIERLKILSHQEQLVYEKDKEENLAFQEGLKEVYDGLKDFYEKGEDFLKEWDKLTPEELELRQSTLTEIIEDVKREVARLPEITIPYSTLIEQVNQIYSDVEVATELFSNRVIEMAIKREEITLELAQELREDLEMWLPDIPDRLRWELEEPLQPIDVPMVELPEVLEDLIGELLEREEDLIWEAEDLTSSWADSLSSAGWAVMDGPISSFSAKGKTGNVLPNINEITGRSGEGRTGPTSGELVQRSMQGLGGRKTPLRYTPDQPMEGVIQEKREIPAGGGTTSGGKLAGSGGGGLPGVSPYDYIEGLRRLERESLEIMGLAKGINWSLSLLGYPVEKLEEGIKKMEEARKGFSSKNLSIFLRKHRQVLMDLAEAREEVEKEIQWRKEKSLHLPLPFRLPLLKSMREEYPPEFKLLLNEYFHQLSSLE